MDYKKEFDELQTSMENFDVNLASKLLLNADFVTNNAGEIISLLGKHLTEDNFKNRPDYFNFCEAQLFKISQTEAYQEVVFYVLDLIGMDNCMLSSSVFAAVTLLENQESVNRVCLEYLLTYTFDSLIEMDETNLKNILPKILNLLIRINKHFQQEQSILYYFARVSFLVLQVKIDPVEYVNILSSIINDPFYLLELEFEEIEEKIYLASFFYLYFKTGMIWGPKIYNQFYVLKKCFNLALSVFENNSFGKSFAKLILAKFKDNEIPLHLLNKIHEEFILEAAQSSMYNEQLTLRKESFEALIIYMNKLCSDAQYIVFKYTFSKLIDSCIKAELIIRMKELILLKIKSNQNLGFFQGVRLLEMIQICFNIPKGPKCNVVENKEYVLAVISVLYVLYSYHEKVLNMGDAFISDVKKFVSTVQSAIDYTNKQYLLESKKLENKYYKDDDKIENLPKLPENEQKNLLSQCNTTTRLVQLNLDMFKELIKGCYQLSVENISL